MICALLFLLSVTLQITAEPSSAKCEPIRVDLCRGLGYNVTGMTNDLQSESEITLQTFTPLIQFGCSAQLHFFLCSVYVPMCTEKVANPIGPCRSLCESVRSRCFPVLQEFGFPWPAALNCSNFPKENNHESMCMEGPGEVGGTNDHTVLGSSNGNLMGNTKFMQGNPFGFATQCPRLHVFVSRSGKCGALCDADVFWDESEKSLAEVWLETWCIMCFTSSVLALLSFLVEPNRLRYPERPLAMLALCYLLCAVGWGVRALAGRRAVGCQHEISDSNDLNGFGHDGHVLLAQDGLANPNCAVVFLLLYYFGMAGCVWWVMVCLCWTLASCRRWSHEHLQKHSSLIHVVGWGLPAIQTITVLMRRNVDADELTGICYVGNQDPDALVLMVLTPQIIYLFAGVLCLVVGYISLWNRQLNPPNIGPVVQPLSGAPPILGRPRLVLQPTKSAGLFKLGVFGALYAIPLACVIASQIHELWARREWQQFGIPQPSMVPIPRVVVPLRPLLWVALLKIFMSLIVGVTAIAWVWSSKTLRAWQKVFQSILGPAGYRQPPVKCVPLTHAAPAVHYCSAPPLSAVSSSSRHTSSKYSAPYRSTKSHRKHHKYSGSETIL